MGVPVGVPVGVVEVSVGLVGVVLELGAQVELGTVEVAGLQVEVGSVCRLDVGAPVPVEAPPVEADAAVDATAAVGVTVGVTVISVGGVAGVCAAGVGVGGSTVVTVVVPTRPGAGEVGGVGTGVIARVTLIGGATPCLGGGLDGRLDRRLDGGRR